MTLMTMLECSLLAERGIEPSRWDWRALLDAVKPDQIDDVKLIQCMNNPLFEDRRGWDIRIAMCGDDDAIEDIYHNVSVIQSAVALRHAGVLVKIERGRTPISLGYKRSIDPVRSLPIPFLVDYGCGRVEWAAPNYAAGKWCEAVGACQVCGEKIDDECWFVAETPPEHAGDQLSVIDDYPLHERCAKLAVRVCPGMQPDWSIWRVSARDWVSAYVDTDKATYVSLVSQLAQGATAHVT